jgi:hypothetical protein
MAKSNLRPLAVLHTQKVRKIGSFIEKIRAIVLDMTNNVALFPSPTPTLATVTTHITALEAAEDVAKTRVAGSVAARDQQYDVVLDDAHGLLAYVQTIADNAANEEDSIAIINASGFDLKHHGVRVKPAINVSSTKVSGTIQLVAKSPARRAANEWQMSTDRTIWTNLPATLMAKTTVAGLTPGSTIYFRHRPVVKGTAPSGWTQIVSIIVT